MDAPREKPVNDIEDLISVERTRAPSCSCNACCNTCHGIPGAYDPFTLKKHLANGKISEEAFGRLVCDFYSLDDKDVYYLRPAMAEERPGTNASFWAPMRPSGCSLLTSKGCSLSRDTMPTGCITGYGCSKGNDNGITVYEKHEVPTIWGNSCGMEIIERWRTLSITDRACRDSRMDLARDFMENMMSRAGQQNCGANPGGCPQQ